MTTLSRELKTIFNKVLLNDGIYPDDDEGSNRARESLSERLSEAAKKTWFSYQESLRKVSAPTLERNRMLLLFSERINALLNTSINFQKNLRGQEVTIHAAWAKLIDFLSEREAEGETIEAYAEWYNSPEHPSDAPKIWKIEKDPMLIKFSWSKAFPKTVEAEPIKVIEQEETTITPEELQKNREELLERIARMEELARERKRKREAQS